jgi:hypothetical protein
MYRRGFGTGIGLALVLAAHLARPAAAAPAGQPSPHATPPAKDMLAPAEVAKTISGIIKGKPVAHKYTVVSGKKSTVVDANKAVIRSHGRFASPADLSPGSYVKAVGSMNGSTFVAKTIDITRAAGSSTKKK